MATTPGGLPYPVGTDFVVDGDNAIRALAEKIEVGWATVPTDPVAWGVYYNPSQTAWQPFKVEVWGGTRVHMFGGISVKQDVTFGAQEYQLGTIIPALRPTSGHVLRPGGFTQSLGYGYVTILTTGVFNIGIGKAGSISGGQLLVNVDFWYSIP